MAMARDVMGEAWSSVTNA